MEIRILDDGDAQVPAGGVGRVAVRAPVQMRGYWADPEQTSAAFTSDGWFVGTDLGRFADDNLVLMGRRSDVYIRGGFNVHPLEVEHVLGAHSAVDAVAVVGTAAPVIGEIGVAFVVVMAGADVNAAELRQWCRASIADYKMPDHVEFLDALPLNAMMKVDKRELARRAARIEPALGRR